MNLQTLDKFHETRVGHLVFGLVELGLTLLTLNWAIDDGSLWVWTLAFIFLFGFVQNFVHVMTVHKK